MPDYRAFSWPPHTFLGRLPENAVREAVELGRLCHFTAQEYLLRENEGSDHVLLLLAGIVKIIGGSSDRDVLISLRVGGDVVGDLAALNGRQRIATVMACHTVQARRMTASRWQEFLSHSPAARSAYTQVLGDRLRLATRRQVDLGGSRPPVRVARILAELTRLHGSRTARGIEIDVAVTQVELAAAAGCSEASLRQILRDLRTSGVLATEYRRYVVLDPAALFRLADTCDPGDPRRG